MNIIKLTFQNINSLKGTNTIDFTSPPLSQTGIFAITGPTGSGKSTILDAITLALFNQTPRTGTLSKSRIEELGAVITRNTFESFAEIEYEVLEKRYRSKWSIHKSPRTENLQDYHMELASLPDGALFDLKKSEVPQKNAEIIGLNYDQFIKAILLSQGDFARFLKANPNERGELLEKITGTQVYRELGILAFQRIKEEKEKLTEIEIRSEDIKILSKENIDELHMKRKKLNEEVVKRKKDIDATVKAININKQIEKLSGEKRQQQNVYNKTNDKWNEFQNELKKLKNHEDLLAIKSELDEHSDKMSIINELDEKTNKLKNDLKTQTEKINALTVHLNRKEKNIKDADSELRRLLPVFREVKELDNNMKQLDEKIREENELYTLRDKELRGLQNELKKLEKQHRLTQSELKETTEWLTKNFVVRDLIHESGIISEKFSARDKEIQNIQKKIAETPQGETRTKMEENISWQDKQAFIQSGIEKITREIVAFEAKLSHKPEELPGLNQKIINLREQHADAKEQFKSCQLSEKYNNTINELNEINIQQKKNLEQIRTDKQRLKHEKEILLKRVEELQARHERHLLEEKYANVRKKLKKGEPCFLCGSKSHPYVQQYVSQKDTTEQALKDAEKEVSLMDKELSIADKQSIRIETDIANNVSQIKNLKDDIQAVLQEFNSVNSKNDWEHSIDRGTAIENKMKNIVNEGKELANQIKLLGEVSKFQTQKQQMAVFVDDMNEIIRYENEIMSFLDKYTDYLDEMDELKKAPEILNKLKEKYLGLQEKKQTSEQKIETSSSVMSEKKSAIKKLDTEMGEMKKRMEQKTVERTGIREKRFSRLENDNPDEKEEKMRNHLKDLNDEVIKLKETLIKTNSNRDATEKSISETINQTEKTKEKTDALSKIISPKLEELGYKNATEAQQYILKPDEAELIRNREKEILHTISSLKQSILEKEKELTGLQAQKKMDKSTEELEQILAKQEKEQEDTNREIGSINNRLEEDNKNREQKKKLTKALEQQHKEYTKWESLGRLIADSEGKKFSKFAQELTLHQLTKLANKHLGQLYSRYKLMKTSGKARDNLYIIDTYLGNTSRSVQTLSGGESFLVSLSLALGLSDLAGKDIRIRSLFIDEGFGSLDEEALDLALTTLEKLQLETKRTIGVISHVPALKERITTQIELQRTSSGFSKIALQQ